MLGRSSFHHQLAATFATGILCLALLSSVAISTLSNRTIRAKLIEQGLRATESLAEQSTLALLYLSTDNVEEPVQTVLGFPDVVGVGVYDLAHKPLLVQGQNPTPSDSALVWPSQLQLDTESFDAWYFVAPVYVRQNRERQDSPFRADSGKPEELIGFVRVKMSKETLRTVAGNILKTNLAVSIGFALVLLLLLLAITKRLTTPLKNLARIMGRASSGEKNLRADVWGPKDILVMENAFNTMMTVLETRELQLEKARDAALESARIKGEFAANVSHELRTPLNGVLGMLELLQDMGLTPKQQEYVAVARTAGESLLKLIDDILDFSRTESGKLKFDPVDFDLPNVLDEVLGLVGNHAQRKKLELGYSIDDDVPSHLRGDPARIRQVLVNLVGNAIKFTERGTVEIRVKTEWNAVDAKAWLRFEVVDSGIGIPQEAQQRIFEAFTQVDGSTTRTYGGAGLGLAICRKLANFMGGDIGVISQPGLGSTFWFTLPLERSLQFYPKDKRDGLAGLRLLIVDDSPITRRLLEQLAKNWGIAYDSAANAYAALQMLQTAVAQGTPYNFALLDEFMPGIGGIDLARQIAEIPALASIAVILLTDTLRAEIDEERPSNIIGAVSKPVRAQFLYDCLAQARRTQKNHSQVETRHDLSTGFQKRILVAEDNRASQQVAIGMLERLGCEIRVATTGQESFELVRNEAFDLVLMDCHMPQMDGYEATRRIRALEGKRGEVPIIAMTANTQRGDSESCIAAGMDDYLPKPLTLDLLRDKLGRWLAGGKDRLEPAPGAVQDPGSRYMVSERPKAALLDEKVLNKLREDTGEAFVQVIEVFLEDTPGYLRALEKAIADEDFEALVQIAHTIKGSGRNLGAQRLVAIAQQLENLSPVESRGQAGALFARLATEYEFVKAELEQYMQPDPEGDAPERQESPRILVADDDRAMRFALLNVLQKDGYQIEQATNGVQAVSLCEHKMPDLVLMDARMPRMDGFTACSRIRELDHGVNIPVLIITALDDDHSIERAFSAGATDYIPKPIHFSVLRQRVARMLEASRAQQHVTRLAYQDALTGLPNRTLFRERLESSLSRTDPESREKLHAVLFLDLDRFKLANDTMGHEIGDLLLKTAAVRIQECLRAGDMVSRFGGDEFTVLLEDIGSPERAAMLAERICKTIAKPFVFVGRELYLSTSIGISMYPADGLDPGTLIKHADMAMYRAKERGNTFSFFEDNMASAISKKLKLESDLRHALEHEEFLLHYQPQVDLLTGQIVGMEALIRWQHPDFGLIPPSQFIGLAEETGLIEELGEWALMTACTQNKAWQDAGLPKIVVAINLSARQLEIDFETRVIRKVLTETKLDPQYLELELTESVVMKDPGKTREILRSLKEAGISISIDDFGTGYSSLNHLKNFSFDKLKIDQSFIRDVHSNPEDAGIVLTIIAMARTLKLKVIAEGIETQDQWLYLRRNGCDEGQGFYFSKALPAEEVIELFHQTHYESPPEVHRA